jgi:multidrug efflux pump subunit AcrB
MCSGKVPFSEALQTAAETRLTPIFLTAVTTIAGLLPLTLIGGSMWAPMGWTIIGGLMVSTLLTLVIVPVSYKLLEQGSEKNKNSAGS